MSATPPIPIFSGSVITSIKGAAIHCDCGRCGCVMMMLCDKRRRGAQRGDDHITHRGDEHRVNAPKKVYMRMSTSSGNDKYGAREKLTKRRT
jgi:hypothetical protein